MKIGFNAEPAVWVGVVEAIIAVAVAVKVPVSPELKAGIIALVLAIGKLVIRQNVTPTTS